MDTAVDGRILREWLSVSGEDFSHASGQSDSFVAAVNGAWKKLISKMDLSFAWHVSEGHVIEDD